MITWWKQSGNDTMRCQTANGTKLIPFDQAQFQIKFFESQGYKITDHKHKITAEKQ